MTRLRSPSDIALSFAFSASLVSAYSFVFSSTPKQCANLTIDISGSGSPPYWVLIIPYGPSTVANNVEVRTIVYQVFPGNGSSVSFPLKFPAESQFVAVVSDASGFGSGGTSVAASVTSSSDTSCFNASQSVSPLFTFNISPSNQVVQCGASRLWWDPSNVQGTPIFRGVIPGGDSFQIPQGPITNNDDHLGTGFSWTAPLRAGTTLLIVSGDDRGPGTGGSDLFTVSAGLFPNSSCITNLSPSSTAGSPAGGSYPTNASGGTTSGSGSSVNTGAIVGGVIGGLAAIVILALVAFYIIRRKTAPPAQKERPVNLLQDPDDNEPPSDYHPPPYLQPDPYLVTEPTIASSAQEDGLRNSALLSDSLTSSAWRQSAVTSFSDRRSATPELEVGVLSPGSTTGLTSSRKSAMTRQLRAVNIIQHEDAGPSSSQEPTEPETIELPPAYTNIRKQES